MHFCLLCVSDYYYTHFTSSSRFAPLAVPPSVVAAALGTPPRWMCGCWRCPMACALTMRLV